MWGRSRASAEWMGVYGGCTLKIHFSQDIIFCQVIWNLHSKEGAKKIYSAEYCIFEVDLSVLKSRSKMVMTSQIAYVLLYGKFWATGNSARMGNTLWEWKEGPSFTTIRTINNGTPARHFIFYSEWRNKNDCLILLSGTFTILFKVVILNHVYWHIEHTNKRLKFHLYPCTFTIHI